jgi:catechol 2,3-dioxygenase-like lactoylglutathione lyase family enzyme
MRDPSPVYVRLRRGVLDQDEALAFYTEKLGFEVNTDATMDDFRWLTVSPPGRPEHELILLVPGPPMMDEESAAQVKALVAKDALGPDAFEPDDCRASHAELSARGVNLLSEPADRSMASRRRSTTTRATGSA